MVDFNKFNMDGIMDFVTHIIFEMLRIPYEFYKKIPWQVKVGGYLLFVAFGVLMAYLLIKHRHDWRYVKF